MENAEDHPLESTISLPHVLYIPRWHSHHELQLASAANKNTGFYTLHMAFHPRAIGHVQVQLLTSKTDSCPCTQSQSFKADTKGACTIHSRIQTLAEARAAKAGERGAPLVHLGAVAVQIGHVKLLLVVVSSVILHVVRAHARVVVAPNRGLSGGAQVVDIHLKHDPETATSPACALPQLLVKNTSEPD